MVMDPDLLKILLGGGGAASVVYAVVNFFQDRRKGRIMDEDTALSRLKADYERKDQESRKGWRLVGWYRSHYILARDHLPPEQREEFPPGPPADIDY